MEHNDFAPVEIDPQGRREPAGRLSNEVVQSLYETFQSELLAFLTGVLRNVHDANEVAQIVFRKLLESGHTARDETIKGWIFKVALREALDFRRSDARRDRLLANYSTSFRGMTADLPIRELTRQEDVEKLKRLLGELPSDQQHVVRQRIYADKTFAMIAEELNLPIGTVLTRMRLALAKLRKWLSDD